MKLGAASLAIAGVTGCSRTPLEKIVPYVDGPSQATYGKPVYFASAHVRDGYAAPSTTEIAGRVVLRLCTINPRTTLEEIERTIRRMEVIDGRG